ncbi:hypothetical protein J6590_015441 [Homalodisca vitripennis]|nr:hypothetical protein J6590_015441 [Homalodisca vitripennis]
MTGEVSDPLFACLTLYGFVDDNGDGGRLMDVHLSRLAEYRHEVGPSLEVGGSEETREVSPPPTTADLEQFSWSNEPGHT